MSLTSLFVAAALTAAAAQLDRTPPEMPAAAPTTRASSVDPAAVAAAHGRSKIPPGTVFHGKLTVRFGDNNLLDAAEIWFKPSGAVVRLEADGATAVADGRTAWISPPDADMPMPRFQLYTWPYFAVAAFKLDDAGANLAPMPPAATGDAGPQPMSRAKMTFDAGTGDAPDDWYVLYVDGQNRLEAMAYIVTYGKTKQQAEAEPHGIVYRDFADVPDADGKPTGVRMSASWSFRTWSPESGFGGDEIGTATLAGLELVPPPPGAFDVPAGAREVPAPQ